MSLPWPFFAYRKDWWRNGVATLQEIGQDWGKRLEKGLAKDWMVFFLSPHHAWERERQGARRTGHTWRWQQSREAGGEEEQNSNGYPGNFFEVDAECGHSLTRGFNRMCHVQRLHLPVKQRCLRLQRLVEKGLVHSRSDCRRSMLQHIMFNGGCSCLCDAWCHM